MRYELATLTIAIGAAKAVSAGIEEYVQASDARGTLLGCWISEIGVLNEVTVLRGFTDDTDWLAERQRMLASANPFNCASLITRLSLDAYAPFPFCAPVVPGSHGQVYEIRTYRLKHGGLIPTIAAWQTAVPARTALSPLVIAMHALDGEPRFTHIWPYPSIEARAAIRTEAVAQGIWPPKGGPDWLTGDMRSTLAVPLPISPLH